VLLTAVDTPLGRGELTAGEAARLAELHSPRGRRLWLTARHALRRALVATGRPADTSAHRFPSPVASLSHAGEVAVAAVLLADADGVTGLGVDVELGRCPDPRTAPLFLTAAELSWLDGLSVPRRPAELLRLWTAKEALFKADPDNDGRMLRDYATAWPAARHGWATRRGGGEFRYASFTLPRGALTVALRLCWQERNSMRTIDFDAVATHISSLISMPVERLTPDVTLAEIVPDSFTMVEVSVDLQEEFDVVLRQQDLKDMNTLDDLVALLRSRRTEQLPD
jgi:acyl carrier protein/phosphopantetheinyl transferase (holo-ACP synthase)